MSPHPSSPDPAARVADRLRNLPPPWDVYAERSRRYEIHLSAGRVELVRGPVAVEGYGIRVLRPREGSLGSGLQASTDFSSEGVAQVVSDAEENARYATFPAKSIELPSSAPSGGSVSVVDRKLWENPSGELERFVGALQAAFEQEPGASVTFGSVKVALTETSIANSSGLSGGYSHATVQSEIGVLASGGPEGVPAGEYWVTGLERRLDTDSIPEKVRDWVRFARDARRAKAPPTGEVPVLMPPELLDGILPGALDFQFSGAGRLHELAPPQGTVIGPEFLSVHDDGQIPWAVGSAPFDDEGVAQHRRELVRSGATRDLLCDLAHASAIGQHSTGSGWRVPPFGPAAWQRFVFSPQPSVTTIAIPGSTGGSDEELIEAAGDGVWVQQMGWPSPNGATTAFGGEIRIGYRIRNGKLAEPVRGGTVGGRVVAIGEGHSLFRDLAAAGSKPQLVGSVYVPTLLTKGLTVSGETA
jgi:TldD protein